MSNNLGGTRAASGMSLDAAIAALNDGLGEHDAAKTESLELEFTNATETQTLTAAQMIGNVSFKCTTGSPAPDSACVLNVPALNADGNTLKRGFFQVWNATGQDLTVQKSGQSETAPTLSDGQKSILLYDGSNVLLAVPQGVVGGDGADGADGTDPGLLYTFDTTTTDADPGAGKLRADNADLSASTTLYIDDLDRSGNNHAATLLTWDDSTNTVKGHLLLSRASDGAQTIFTVGTVTAATGYTKVAVTYVSGVTGFTAADAISAQFYRAGDEGAAGGGATDLDSLTDVDLTTTPPSDGDTLVYDSGTSTWVPGSGGGGGGTFSGALVKKAADQTGADYTSAAPIAWGTESYDEGGWYDAATDNTIFTVPAGVSRVRLATQLTIINIASGSWVHYRIEKWDGSAWVQGWDGCAHDIRGAASVTQSRINISTAIVSVSEGDQFRCGLTNGSDSSIDIDAALSWFSIEKVA